MSSKRVLLYGLACWSLYVSLRIQCVRLLPITAWPSYVRQDLAITILRLACGWACLNIARKRWFASALGLGKSAPLSLNAWLAIAVALSGALLATLSGQPNWLTPFWIRAVEVAIALVVAFNEEVGFRLLIYGGFREITGRTLAVVISALLFALMHLGYQATSTLPQIFLMGLFFAFLRDRGVSLRTLVLVHFLYDGLFGILMPQDMAPWPIFQILLGLAALAVLLAWASPERHVFEGESLLFVYGSLRSQETAAIKLGIPRRCDSLGSATISGTLTEFGGYPSLITARAVNENVPGEILRLRDPFLLEILDQYEGEGYRREMRDVILPNGCSLSTWVYCKSDVSAFQSVPTKKIHP